MYNYPEAQLCLLHHGSAAFDHAHLRHDAYSFSEYNRGNYVYNLIRTRKATLQALQNQRWWHR